MKLVVLGATGGVGLEIVRQAIERGHAVTAFVRSPDQLKTFSDRITFLKGVLLQIGRDRQRRRACRVRATQQHRRLCG